MKWFVLVLGSVFTMSHEAPMQKIIIRQLDASFPLVRYTVPKIDHAAQSESFRWEDGELILGTEQKRHNGLFPFRDYDYREGRLTQDFGQRKKSTPVRCRT